MEKLGLMGRSLQKSSTLSTVTKIRQPLSALPVSNPTARTSNIHSAKQDSKLLQRWLYLIQLSRNHKLWEMVTGVSAFLLLTNCRPLVKEQSFPIPVPPVPWPCVLTLALVSAQMTSGWVRAGYRYDTKHTSLSSKKANFCLTNHQCNGSNHCKVPISPDTRETMGSQRQGREKSPSAWKVV